MKKFLVFGAIAVVTVVFGELAFRRGVEFVVLRSEFRLAKLYSGRLKGDVLVFGNSRAVNSFLAPRLTALTGREWVNLGYNGFGPEIVEALIRDYLDSGHVPKVIVLEISNVLQGNEGIRDCRVFARWSERLAEIDRVEHGWNAEIGRRSSLVGANSELFMRCLYYLFRSDQTWVNSGSMDSDNLYQLKALAGAGVSVGVSNRGVEAFRRLISFLKSQDIEVWCVVGPYLLNDGDYSFVQKWGDAIWGGRTPPDCYLNFSRSIDAPELFADPIHLNGSGSLRLSDIIRDELLMRRM